MFRIALRYVKGEALPKDKKKSFDWLMRSASRGDALGNQGSVPYYRIIGRAQQRPAARRKVTMATSTYQGDSSYTINCTGDACVGDRVCFERALFTGSFRRPKFAGFERIEGEIIGDSYGAGKQQHTFTLRLTNGEQMLIKGRNLYREGCWRRPWADEAARASTLAEKHARGEQARSLRDERRMSYDSH